MASGWPSSVFSVEASAEAAAPVEVAVAPSDVVDTPPAKSEPSEEQEPPVQFAPVTVQLGGIGYVMQRQKSGSSKYSTQSLNTNVKINAESFIWESWFARVKGGMSAIEILGVTAGPKNFWPGTRMTRSAPVWKKK
ncbi:MAG: hypothetical protein OEV15_07390, partial [Gallionella sp.]|nr:hypothetical protein [Gallionella sp.]